MGVLILCVNAVGVFYNPSRLGKQALVNVVGEVEPTSLIQKFFPRNSAECNHREAEYFFYWWRQGVFLKDFPMNVVVVKSLYWVSGCSLKLKFNNITVILPYKQYKFSSLKLCLWGKQCRFILVNPLHFASNIVTKDPLFVTCIDILKKRVISRSWKKTCRYRYVIFFILLTKSMRNQNAQLAHLSYLFFLYCGRLWIEYFCVDYIPLILLKHLDPGLRSVLAWVHLSMTYCQKETLKTSFDLGGQFTTPWP